jgi:hypothetical protein
MQIGEPIETTRLIAVEGKDEVNFIGRLLDSLNISDVEIVDIGGKDKFKGNIPILIKSSGFDNLTKFGIIRDADKNASSAFTSIRNILKKNNLSLPTNYKKLSKGSPNIGIYILPDNKSSGMLEDLCLKTVEGSPILDCVNIFEECLKKIKVKRKNRSKSRAMCYLSAMEETVYNVGIAARMNYWDFESKHLNDLKEFLIKFR